VSGSGCETSQRQTAGRTPASGMPEEELRGSVVFAPFRVETSEMLGDDRPNSRG
jgi:hypothetical protein